MARVVVQFGGVVLQAARQEAWSAVRQEVGHLTVAQVEDQAVRQLVRDGLVPADEETGEPDYRWIPSGLHAVGCESLADYAAVLVERQIEREYRAIVERGRRQREAQRRQARAAARRNRPAKPAPSPPPPPARAQARPRTPSTPARRRSTTATARAGPEGSRAGDDDDDGAPPSTRTAGGGRLALPQVLYTFRATEDEARQCVQEVVSILAGLRPPGGGAA